MFLYRQSCSFLPSFWLFRGIHLALAPVLTVQIAMGWAVGILILSGVTFNILSMLVPVIAMVIGIADGIHLVSRYREETQALFRSYQITRSYSRRNEHGMFLDDFYNSWWLRLLLVADTTVIQDFGLHSSVAVVVTYIGIMILIPLWLRFIPDDVFEHNLRSQPQWTHFFEWIHHFTTTKRMVIIALSGVLCVLVGWIASQITADSYILEMYDDKHPTVDALHTMEEHLSGIVPVFIYLESDTSLHDRWTEYRSTTRAETPNI